ncbi:hypothetical protein C7212DRAFT_359207 [Tuber magnatum]|uniref:S-adenosyl-L-methionine-dependent methyltransferase n=1 Tax=Tuber magnatum TaxID=42249 RepID=A0A317SI04_9PEZI|nr:hypothetical protein C7212DRAFT_359207 [Tuber magnatum]
MPLSTFIPLLHEINDAYEESVTLFATKPPSKDLGFLDPKSPSLDITIGSRDLTIQQSPSLLSSPRDGETTVLWRVTPLFATYLSHPENPFFSHGVLSSRSTVLELGCGVAGVLGLTLGSSGRVRGYFLSDQEYVLKLLRRNLEENTPPPAAPRKGGARVKAGTVVRTLAMDWEKDRITREHPVLKEGVPFDAVIACDCIYNEALVEGFVEALEEACRELSAASRGMDGGSRLSEEAGGEEGAKPTLAIIAQELRSPEVFETWLERFHRSFHTYRIPDSLLTPEINSSSGYSVHVGILRD